MITSLKLENFRAFTELKVAPLKRINLFAGANNTGKTGVLEALYLLFYGNSDQIRQLPSAFRSCLSLTPQQNGSDDVVTFWQALFFDRQTEIPVTIEVETESRTFSYCKIETGPNGEIVGRHGERDAWGTIVPVDPSTPHSFMIGPIGNVGAYWPKPFTSNIIVISTQPEHPTRDAEFFNQVTLQEGGEEKLLHLLREIDPRLQKLRYAKPPGTSQPLVYASFVGVKNAVSVTQTGQGFSKLFSLYSQILTSKAKVLLIDEIENGLYYETMPQIWKGIAALAASENIQVFATTHSRECLIAAHETMKTQPSYDFALHRLQRVNGNIEAVTHDQGMLEVALKTGLEVR
jgi:hypothetical protein